MCCLLEYSYYICIVAIKQHKLKTKYYDKFNNNSKSINKRRNRKNI